MQIFRGAMSLILLFCLDASAHGEIIAQCFSSKGFSYFPSLGLNPKSAGEFQNDGISKGSIWLDRQSNGNFDLLFSDGSDRQVSSIAEGGKVFRIGQGDQTLTIAVIYPNLSEVYTFMNTRSGPEVMWTTNKHSTPVLKAAAYFALCGHLELQN